MIRCQVTPQMEKKWKDKRENKRKTEIIPSSAAISEISVYWTLDLNIICHLILELIGPKINEVDRFKLAGAFFY